MRPKELYADRIKTLTEEIYQLNRHNQAVVVLELSAVALAVGCVVAYTMWSNIAALAVGALFIAAYVAIRWKDSQNSRLSEQKESLRSVYQKEVAYLDGDFSAFPSGDQYVDPHHAFTLDLDIFGPQSLFNRINRTVTTGGSDYLAKELAETRVRSIDEIERRREAIREMAEKEPLRAAFLAQGGERQIDTTAIMEALQEVQQLRISRLAAHRFTYVAALGGIIIFYGLLAGAVFGPLSGAVPMLWVLLEITAVYLLFGRTLKRVNRSINIILPRLGTYVGLIMQIVTSDLKSQEGHDIIKQLSADKQDALKSFRLLKGIIGDLDRRNEVWVPISNALYLADFFIVRRFLLWQDRYMMRIEDWIDAVSHFDALVSMATFRYNEPEATEAQLVDADEVVYEARGLYHPFLGQKAVRNDFSISDRHYYIITGANMAGKSTFLRSIGINYVLACCGMPVFADGLRVSLFSLFSSMRTTDDLAHGISYFNAELLRLQQLIETCRQNRHTLIILDEILKGTNSLDKLNGSQLFLQSVATLPVTGIIATHDLELSKMEQEYPDRFHNYCFEIQLSDKITYTYRLSEGVARNQNATYLLRNILKTAL
ncbi:MAG: DNA mismatch repair protein MutS [Prevotella sp.]|nr:DNA mismatch repair protein MutS [Prevotella sp.]MBQ9672988.1 DNA mismatch repair protein MutS [Prevotella sp.]